jgi:hypothetical protein
MLALLAIVLGIANLTAPRAEDSATAAVPPPEVNGKLDTAIDATLARHGIEPSSVRRIAVRPAGGGVLRWELRTRVPATFPSLLLNHDLSIRLLPLGATVTGVENTQEGRTSLHVRLNGSVVRTIVLQETG